MSKRTLELPNTKCPGCGAALIVERVITMFALVNGYRALSIDADSVAMKGKP